jgi:acyl-CoA synthetase (AMP-forming)/AMP-acid ligase II
VAIGFTIVDCVAASARAFPDRVALEVLASERGVDPVETWTYGQIWDRVEDLAAAVSPVEAGGHGPMTAILLPNGADHVLAYLAAARAGAAAVPINNRLAGPEIDYVLADSGASVLLAGEPFLGAAIAAAATTGTRVVDVGSIPRRSGRAGGPSGPVTGPDEAAMGLVAYTSGTTGFPKGSTVTHRALLTRFAQWGWTFGLSPDQVLSTPGPLFHLSYGGLSLAHLATGGRNRIMTGFDAGAALDEYADHSNWVFLVPSMTAMIDRAWEEAGKPPLQAVRWMLSSGAPGPMSLLDRAFDLFPRARITEAYGWTEGGWVTYERKVRDALVPHSVGWPMVGSEILLIDPDTAEPVEVGRPGEVAARSIVPFAGYLGQPEATAASRLDGPAQDGFIRSGDMGIQLPDGRLTIVDRVKDMIISGGENVYCAEVERILVEHPAVVEAAVVGLPDPTWGERVAASVVTLPGHAVTAAALDAHCRERLARYKCPRQIELADDLPRNPMGKVQKFRLVERMAAAGDGGPDDDGGPDGTP